MGLVTNTKESGSLIANTGAFSAHRLSINARNALTALSRVGEFEQRVILHKLGIAEPVRSWTPRRLGELPTMTELVPARDRDALYSSPEWAHAYAPVATTVVYVVQCAGLARLSADLGGVSLAKVGTSKPDAIARRHARLGGEEYGAWYRAAHKYVHEAGFDRFDPPGRLQLSHQHLASPIRLSTLGVEVGLPASLSPGEFEARFNDRLTPLRVQTVSDSDAGRALCVRTGVDPARLRRFYTRGANVKLATEFTLMRPQADIGALGRLAADIVIDASLGLRRRRPGR